MAVRLVVHAGFHKTGTTTIQKTLAAHKPVLNDHARILLRRDTKALSEAARAYSISRSDFDLGLVRYEAAVLAEDWTSGTILMSSEDLSGHMPARHGLRDYSAAVPLTAAMTETWHTACPEIKVIWAYTTRNATPWLASCHVQHLRSTRIVLDAQEYAAQYATSADLDGIVARVRREIPDTAVHSFALEDYGNNPVDPLLALADLPETVCAQITPHAPANTSPDLEKIAAFLALNRSDLPNDDWHRANRALKGKAR